VFVESEFVLSPVQLFGDGFGVFHEFVSISEGGLKPLLITSKGES
jgi:hypothetical protein